MTQRGGGRRSYRVDIAVAIVVFIIMLLLQIIPN